MKNGKVIELDLNSTFYCCKAIVPHMIKNNYGRIINIASIAGKEGNQMQVLIALLRQV